MEPRTDEPNEPSGRTPPPRRWLSPLLGLSVAAGAVQLGHTLAERERAQFRNVVRHEAVALRHELAARMEARLLPLVRMAQQWELRGAPHPEAWEADTRVLIRGYPGLAAVAWVDADGRFRWVVPLEGNGSLLDAHRADDPRRRAALDSSRERRELRLSRSVDLVQGAEGFHAYVPIYRDARHLGYIAGVFRFHELFDQLLPDHRVSGYGLALLDGDEEIHARTLADRRHEAEWAQETVIGLHGVTWRLRVWPGPDRLDAALSALPVGTVAVGLFLAVLLGWTVDLARRARFHATLIELEAEQRRRAEEAHRSVEEQLRQSQKMEAIGRLAGGVAHDFNNLLTGILGSCQLMIADLKSGARIERNGIEEIKRSAERAASLTRQLLAFSRQQVMQPTVVDLNGVLAEVQRMLGRIIGEDIELRLLTDPELGPVRADPAQIHQVIMNLAVNARDAMPAGGVLTLETANATLDADYAREHMEVEPGEYVMIAISDDGFGMDEETRDRCFEPFFTTKDRGKGSGIGLATVYGIVKQSGGHISLESERGRGTTFRIYLPRTERQPVKTRIRATPLPLPPSRRRAPATVLVVDDDPQARRPAVEWLRREGYSVLEAGNGVEALQACESHEGTVEVLVTDVVMPGMSGRELAERLAMMSPELRVIYVSGYTDDAIVHHGVRQSAVEYLQKPFTPERLSRKLRELLGAA